MSRATVRCAILSFLSFLSAGPVTHAAWQVPSAAQNIYIVVLRDAPAPTRATEGRPFNRNAPDIAQRVAQLTARHASMLSAIGGARKLYSYTYALNGFAAELSTAQAAKLRADPGVRSVIRNEVRRLDTLTTPAFLELNAPHSAWNLVGGGERAGDGVIVGVIDTGIWPEHASFESRAVHGDPVPGWNGVCHAGEQFAPSSCNRKLIGARWFNAGFGGDAAVKTLFPYEFLSPRAADGHGVHTAGAAVGDYLVNAETAGVKLGRVSGMAPAAHLAVYKACWGFADDPIAGCSIIDSVAAIDQAVADGVHVINFSLGGSRESSVDPIELAFLAAADAGVFVAASAGNDGRLGLGTVAHNSPWVMSVGSATHDRRYKAAVVSSNGVHFEGVSLDDAGVEYRTVVLSSSVGLPGQDAASIALCLPGTLDPARVAGKIIVCDRGQNARLEKSQAVADAGGAGMILVNTSSGTLNADIHSVPTVHLDYLPGIALKRLIGSTPGLKARLTARIIVTGPAVPAPNVAADSSRGPALSGDGDLLKPDLLAPGVDILAAYSPLRFGHDFEFLRGSSMSSAHVAGIAAIVRQAHPGWSAAAVKSALMTTATPRRNDGGKIREEEGDQEVADLFGIGSGLVQPTSAIDPGLVYEASSSDWLGFLCGTGQACFPPLGPIDPSDLNYPSIAVGALVGQQTVTRTVTNVSPHTSRYSVSLQAPAGMSLDVFPSSFTIAPGASQTFKVRFTRTGAILGHYTFGALTWSDGQHRVRSPIAILPQPLAAPAAVHGQAAPLQYSITFGYSGPFKALARGLVPAVTQQRAVLDDPADEINTALSTGRGVVIIPVEVRAGTTYARVSLFDSRTDGKDNLDLYLFDAKGNFVSRSCGPTSNEEVNLTTPAPGQYSAVVHGLETDGPDAHFTLYSWVLGDTRAGNMSVTAPPQAALAKGAVIGLSFSPLEPGVSYLGSVAYSGAPAMPNPTIVRIDH